MGNQDSMRRFIGALIITGLLLGGSGFALAAATDNNAGNLKNSNVRVYRSGISGIGLLHPDMQSILDTLVSAGTITQAQEDNIMAKINEGAAERKAIWDKMKNITIGEYKKNREQNEPQNKGIFTQMVYDGTLTQEQADAVKNAVKDNLTAQWEEQLSTAINGLVDKNIITNQQANAILDKLSDFYNERQENKDAFKDMTAEERRAYSKSNKPQKINPLGELVTAGIITQAQADEINKVIPFGTHKT